MGPRRHDVVDAAVRVYASRERTAVSPRHHVHAPRRPGTLYLYETKFAQEPVPYQDRKEPWWTRRQKRRSQKFRDAVRPEERVIPHGLRNGILVQEYHKRGRIGDMLRICRAEGRSDPLLWILACQTTAGAIPPEVLKRKRYFGLGDDKAEVWDPDAAREADEHTARCANEGYAAEGFVDSDYVRMLRGNHSLRLVCSAGVLLAMTPSTRVASMAHDATAARHRVASMAHDPIVDAGEDVRAKTAAAAAAAPYRSRNYQKIR